MLATYFRLLNDKMVCTTVLSFRLSSPGKKAKKQIILNDNLIGSNLRGFSSDMTHIDKCQMPPITEDFVSLWVNVRPGLLDGCVQAAGSVGARLESGRTIRSCKFL